MNKIALTILAAMLGCIVAQGQTDSLIVKEYDDSCWMAFVNPDTDWNPGWKCISGRLQINIDIDNDGTDDYYLGAFWDHFGKHLHFILKAKDLQYTEFYPQSLNNPPLRNAVNGLRAVSYGDMIEMLPETIWSWKTDCIMPGTEQPMSGTYYAAVRMPARGDSGYYYGWVRFTMEAGVDQRQNEMVRVTVAESALSTIADLPLRVGMILHEEDCVLSVNEASGMPDVEIERIVGKLLVRAKTGEIACATVVDMTGKVVSSTESDGTNVVELAVHGLTSGVYIVVVQMKDGTLASRKFVHSSH
ncbi:MAG: T9SS type A sorting domain-containing protein [Bacteroidales bacterium]|nr:T9SS type A sorting domain-containing protein [Bacteroidales bacterium]